MFRRFYAKKIDRDDLRPCPAGGPGLASLNKVKKFSWKNWVRFFSPDCCIALGLSSRETRGGRSSRSTFLHELWPNKPERKKRRLLFIFSMKFHWGGNKWSRTELHYHPSINLVEAISLPCIDILKRLLLKNPQEILFSKNSRSVFPSLLNEFPLLCFDGTHQFMCLSTMNLQETHPKVYWRKDTLKFSRAEFGMLQTQLINRQ